MLRRRGARLLVPRAPRHTGDDSIDAVLDDEAVPHLSLADFRKPMPPGWTAAPVRVETLPDTPDEGGAE